MKTSGFKLIVIFFFLFAFSDAEAATISANPARAKDGLVLHQTFNANNLIGNTAIDLSGQGNNGTLTNGPIRTIGKFGQALRLNGTSNYVQFADSSSLDITRHITMSAWVKHSGSFNAFEGIIIKGDSSYRLQLCGSGSSQCPETWPVNSFMVAVQSVCSPVDLASNIVPENGRWYHVVGTYDGSALKLYIDGVLVSSQVCGGAIPTNNIDLTVGENLEATGRYWNGDIDDVRVYNRALSSAEIATLYKAGGTAKTNDPQSTRNASGLVLAQSFDGRDLNFTSNIAFDRSGLGNSGSLINMSTSSARVIGNVGQALRFDGLNDKVVIPASASLDITSSGAISVWAKIFSTSQNILVGKDSGGYFLGANDDGLITWGKNGAYQLLSNITYPLNRWIHIVATRGGGSNKIYINGKLNNSDTGFSDFTAGGNLFIGGGTANGFQMNGLIDEVRVYDRSLSSSEVTALYRSGLPSLPNTSQNTRYTGGLVLAQSFNGPDLNFVSNIAFDRSGAGNNGSLINMSTTTSRVIGKIGQALRFDGNQYINIGNPSSLQLNTFTIAGWIKWGRSSPSGGNVDIIAGYGNSGYAFAIGDGVGGPRSLGLTKVQVTQTVSALTIPDTNWHFVAVVKNASTNEVTFYVDGASETKSDSQSFSFGTNFAIGNRQDNLINPFVGVADEMRVYSRALSAGDVGALYRAGR